MSHSVVLVLVPKDALLDDGVVDETDLAKRMAPFDENESVPEYETECYCAGRVARNEAREKADQELGTLDSYREKLREQMKPEYEKLEALRTENGWKVNNSDHQKALDEIYKTEDRLWKELTAARFAREEELFKESEHYGKADPECDDCHGSGKRKTTYNPKSRWDWYVIGGRWTGKLLPGYDVEKDPRNFEKCFLCGGTGMRNDSVGQAYREEHPDYTCNGCDGTGKRLKFSGNWVEPPAGGNVRPVEEILAAEDLNPFIPFAFLTPEGEWVEQGEMGWFGVVHDKKPEDDWNNTARQIFEKYRDHVAIVVDVHI